MVTAILVPPAMQIKCAGLGLLEIRKAAGADECRDQANGDQRHSQQHCRATKARRLPITLKHTNGFRHKSGPSGPMIRRGTVLSCPRVVYRLVLTGATT